MEQPVKTPFDDLRKQALEHYEELATKAHHWNSFIPKAIEAYNPEAIEQYLKWLDEELLDCEKSFGDSRVIAWRDALTAAKQKFLSLTQPQSINNGNEIRNTR